MGFKIFDGKTSNKARFAFTDGDVKGMEADCVVLVGANGEGGAAGTATDPFVVTPADPAYVVREGEANANGVVLFEQDCRRFNHMALDLKGPFTGTLSIFVSNDPTDANGWRAHPDTPTINTVSAMTNFALKAGYVQVKSTTYASGTAKAVACFKSI